MSKIVSLGASLILAVATVVLGAGAAAADRHGATDAPTDLRVTDLGANTATVTWDPVPEAHKYLVEALKAPNWVRRGASTVEEPIATFFLEQGTTYRIRVRAYLGGTEWTDGAAVKITTPVDADNPAPVPTNVRVTQLDSASVKLAWDPPTTGPDALDYNVRVTAVAGAGRGGFVRVDQPTVTLHLGRDTTYRAEVEALPTAGRMLVYSDPVEFTTPDEPPLSTPGNVRATTAPGSVAVEWDPSSSPIGVKDYRVTLRRDSGSRAVTTSGTTAEFSVPEGAEAEVTVRARDTADRWSEHSNPVEVAVPPADDWEPLTAPSNLRAVSDDSRDGVVFKWDAATGGSGSLTYHLHLDGTEIERTRDLQLRSPYFAECTNDWRTRAEFVVTASSEGVESPASNSITLCFA